MSSNSKKNNCLTGFIKPRFEWSILIYILIFFPEYLDTGVPNNYVALIMDVKQCNSDVSATDICNRDKILI